MTRLRLAISLTALVLGVAALPAAAQTVLEGTTAGGAFYRIAVPDGWEPGDGLVIWNHGFSLSPPDADVDLGPLVDIQLAQGWAVAASSYRLAGWAVFKTNKDLKALVAAFKSRVGSPGPIILTGASLGGAVTVAAIEKAKLGNVVGAYTLCGAVAGSRNWDGALDLRLVYDFVCRDVPEGQIPGGRTGLEKNSQLTEAAVEDAVNACTGWNRPRARRSREQRQNLERLVELSGLPEVFLQTDMWYVTFGMADLVHDRGKLRGKIGIGNENVDYGDPEINAGIERVEPKKRAARKLARSFTPKGKVGDVKIVNIHTDKDGLVIVENQSEYASVVPEENLTIGVVVESQPSHCAFSPPEVVAGWEAVTSWSGGGPQPSAASLQTSCEAFAALLPGPCRFDPDFEIPDMDGRVRPRD